MNLSEWMLTLTLLGMEALCAAVLACAIVLWRWRLIDQLGAAIASKQSSRLSALRRFQAQGLYAQACYLVTMIGLATVPTLFFDMGPFGAQVCFWGIVVIGSLLFYEALTALVLYTPTQRRLRGSAIPRAPYLSHKLKALAVQYTPALLLLEAVGALYWLNFPPYRWLLVVCVALFLVARGVCSVQLQRWLVDAKPLEETPWAALNPRIQAWARRAGISLDRIYASYIGSAGTTNVGVSGVWRPALFIGAAFLSQTDWRQQDAVFCHELGHLRLRHIPMNIAMNTLKGALFAVVLCGIDVRQFDFFMTGGTVPTHFPIFLDAAGVFYLLWAGVYFFDRWRRRRNEFACDTFSAELTGDPLAMAVGLHTVVTLGGWTMTRRAGDHPTPLNRLNALMERLWQGGSLAPWAYTPVPAQTQFTLANHLLTAPFDAAPMPAPVPTTSYPSVAAPFPAPPRPVTPSRALTSAYFPVGLPIWPPTLSGDTATSVSRETDATASPEPSH